MVNGELVTLQDTVECDALAAKRIVIQERRTASATHSTTLHAILRCYSFSTALHAVLWCYR
jgi:hypothetical protein